MAYGRKVIGAIGRKMQVIVDADFTQWIVGGMTVAWGAVAAVGALTSEVQRITITGSPVGGDFTVAGVDPLTGDAFETAAIAYNASAATVLAALIAVIGAGNATATGGALPGTAVDITFAGDWADRNVAQMTADGTGLTGGTSPAIAVTTVTAGIGEADPNFGMIIQPGNKYLRYGQIMCLCTSGTYEDMYGPYDPNASDGRQTLTPGQCFILNETVVKDPLVGVPINTVESDYIGAFDGGRAYIERIIQSGVATHSLAAGPTLAEFNTAFPRIQPVRFGG